MEEGRHMKKIIMILGVLFLSALTLPTLVYAQVGKSTATVTISGTQTSSEVQTSTEIQASTEKTLESQPKAIKPSNKSLKWLPNTGEKKFFFWSLIGIVLLSLILINKIFQERREDH